MENLKTISITPKILKKMNEAIRVSLEFEVLTGKQLNVTSTTGEILACHKNKLKLVVNDINACFDAIDQDGLKVQIKTRRYKGKESARTGPLLDNNYQVQYDYALLVLLNEDYSLKTIYRIDAASIRSHFDRINANRTLANKSKQNTMSINRFKNLALP
jgi:hypothetical protein